MNEPLRLTAVAVQHFRNLAPARLELRARFTLIVGENGQGKTNLLDAVHYALALRPLRATTARELIQHEHPDADVAILVGSESITHARSIHLQRGPPFVRALGAEGKSCLAEEFLIPGAVVSFTPDDLVVVRGGPDRRRRLLDRAIFNRWPVYLKEVRTYQRAIRSRNQLLRSGSTAELRESFETPLWMSGARILIRRRAILAEITPLFDEAYRRTGLGPSKTTLSYDSPVPASGNLEEQSAALAASARDALPTDLRTGFTSVGPHSDELRINLGGRPARLYASQGQARALVLAFKIAEIENLRAQLSRPPILLLDDVSSELDSRRSDSFLRYLKTLSCQVLLTTTDDGPIAAVLGGDQARWQMNQGAVIT